MKNNDQTFEVILNKENINSYYLWNSLEQALELGIQC